MLYTHANFHHTLFSQDDSLRLLDTPLPSTTLDSHPAKRAKLATPVTEVTISTKIQQQLYDSTEELLADFNHAASAVLQNETVSSLYTDPVRNGETTKSVEAQIAGVKSVLSGLVRREMVRRPQTFGQRTQATEDTVTKDGGVRAGLSSTGRMILTLYGKGDSHYGPSRQLFSSLQKPAETKATLNDGIHPVLRTLPTAGHGPIYSPLREAALPNGIIASKNIPTSFQSKPSPVPTIGTLFPPPANLSQLTPPRAPKNTTTRSQTVTFFDPRTLANPSRHRSRTDHYTVQPLSTGQWIGYSANSQDTKKRSRRQSVNERTSPSTEERPAHQQTFDTDDLFKNAYSSFAPNRDDSTALIPVKLKNRIWWDRYGARRFSRLLDSQRIDYSDGIDGVLAEDTAEGIPDDEQEEEFQQLVKDYVPAELPSELQTATKAKTEEVGQVSEKDIDELLAEISEAIETLVAHQRARNLIVTSSTPVPTGLGSPSTPSAAELDVYNLLRDQLKVMISSLPPYAVAKLNGDQLESLAVTTHMPVKGDVGRGVMEDPEAPGRARTNAATSATIPPVARSTYLPRSAYTSTPAASTSRYTSNNTYSTPRTSLGASYPSQTYSGRDTATAQFRSYPSQQPSAAVRTPFTGSQTHHSSYTNGAPSRPSSHNSSHQYSTSTPQRTSQPMYQHRPPSSTSYSSYNATTTLSANTTSYSNHNSHLGTPRNNVSYSNYPSTSHINSYPTHSHASPSRPSYQTAPSTTASTTTNSQAYRSNAYDANNTITARAPGTHTNPPVRQPAGL